MVFVTQAKGESAMTLISIVVFAVFILMIIGAKNIGK